MREAVQPNLRSSSLVDLRQYVWDDHITNDKDHFTLLEKLGPPCWKKPLFGFLIVYCSIHISYDYCFNQQPATDIHYSKTSASAIISPQQISILAQPSRIQVAMMSATSWGPSDCSLHWYEEVLFPSHLALTICHVNIIHIGLRLVQDRIVQLGVSFRSDCGTHTLPLFPFASLMLASEACLPSQRHSPWSQVHPRSHLSDIRTSTSLGCTRGPSMSDMWLLPGCTIGTCTMASGAFAQRLRRSARSGILACPSPQLSQLWHDKGVGVLKSNTGRHIMYLLNVCAVGIVALALEVPVMECEVDLNEHAASESRNWLARHTCR
ncbi:hypothetical protein IMY05_C4820000100 [Salix suchowensis]|nr:hypothetical protein IMY05_C4820000100 [Salix suchowensis]